MTAWRFGKGEGQAPLNMCRPNLTVIGFFQKKCSAVRRRLKCAKFVFGWVSALDPAGGGGSQHVSPDSPIVGWGGGFCVICKHTYGKDFYEIFVFLGGEGRSVLAAGLQGGLNFERRKHYNVNGYRYRLPFPHHTTRAASVQCMVHMLRPICEIAHFTK